MIYYQAESEGSLILNIDEAKSIAYLTINGRRRDPGTKEDYLFIEYVPAPWSKSRLTTLDKDLMKEFKAQEDLYTGGRPTKRQRILITQFEDILLREDYKIAKEILQGKMDIYAPKYKKYASYKIRGAIFGIDPGRITTAKMFKKLRLMGFCISPTMLRQALEKASNDEEQESA